MKKTASKIVVGAMTLALVAGCGNNGGGGTTPADDTWKIGVNYELSGGVSTYGQASVAGIEFAVAQINDAGGIDGKKIQIIKVDNKSEPAEATTLTTRLMTQDKVLTVIGPATSGNFKATTPVAQENSIPVISGSATDDAVTVGRDGKVLDFVFRTCFADSFQGTAMANYAIERLDAKTAVIIKDSASDYAKGLAENFTKTFVAAGGTIVAEEAYAPKERDFNSILTSIKSKDFDVIYLPGYYEEAGPAIKQARELGIDVPVLGPDGFDSPVLAQTAGAAALNNVFFTNHFSALDQDPKVQKFLADWKAKHNAEPDAFNALGYDTMMLVADAIERASDKTSKGIRDALAATEDFDAVTGTLTMDEFHNPMKAITIIELRDGVQYNAEQI